MFVCFFVLQPIEIISPQDRACPGPNAINPNFIFPVKATLRKKISLYNFSRTNTGLYQSHFFLRRSVRPPRGRSSAPFGRIRLPSRSPARSLFYSNLDANYSRTPSSLELETGGLFIPSSCSLFLHVRRRSHARVHRGSEAEPSPSV